ncbi:MAG: hypothetical protein OXG33_08890 [Chloroflexi bacterium]|nr:hypothetical protein [Chloroflexota bacterium]
MPYRTSDPTERCPLTIRAAALALSIVLALAAAACGDATDTPEPMPAPSPLILSPTTTPETTPTPVPTPTATPSPSPVTDAAQTRADSPATDREALIAFYHATDGPNWTDNTNWLSDAPLFTWYGVTTDDDDGRVIKLLLREN